MSVQSFRCPACNASLTYDDSGSSTVQCEYCGTTAIVPEALRQSHRPSTATDLSGVGAESNVLAEIGVALAHGRKIDAIKLYREAFGVGLKEAKEAVEALQRGEAVTINTVDIQTEKAIKTAVTATAATGVASSLIGCVVTAIVILVGLGAAFFLLYPQSSSSISVPGVAEISQLVESGSESGSESRPTAPPFSGYLEQVLVIGGEEGQGPGFFDDTRWLGVDDTGRIYAADFNNDGRIQVFDQDGRFLSQWQIDSQGVTGHMAVARDATVYVLEPGYGIFAYDGNEGVLKSQLPDTGLRFNALATTIGGDLVAVGKDGLAWFNGDGEVLQTVPGIFDNIDTDSPISISNIAVDAAKNIYVVTVFDSAIYKFNEDGVFLDRIGQEGDEPGDFTSPSSLAVDGKGRIFVDDFTDIILFDENGRYLESIKVGGIGFTLLFDTENNLYRMNRNDNQIEKFELLR